MNLSKNMIKPETGQGYEFQYHTGERIVWDVDRAILKILNKPREVYEVPQEQLKYVSLVYEIDPIKLKFADCSIPGIAAPIIDINDNNRIIHILIDGIHRAHKAYDNGFSFYTYILTKEESRDCLLAFSPGCIP